MDHPFEPTRDAALARMDDFLQVAANNYKQRRNYDLGRGHHHHVSRLSPYLRYRMITEEELIGRVLGLLGPSVGRCFIDEVLWRSYWKGHLRHYPSMYLDYLRTRKEHQTTDLEMQERARQGKTGIACFDDWTCELIETGYLHNHARMWWASIWVFTLGLPWQLGATFFEQHLLDADPASNTLSWRWVAGFHTPGKIYQASEQNIATYTQQRYPKTPELALDPKIPGYRRPEPESDPLSQWRCASEGDDGRDTALLVMPHDLHPESQWRKSPARVAMLAPDCVGQHPASAFRRGALQDAQARIQAWSGREVPWLEDLASLMAWVEQAQPRTLWLSAPPLAQALPLIPELGRALRERGLALKLLERSWDRLSWRHAAKGFFSFRKKAGPQLLELAQGSEPVP